MKLDSGIHIVMYSVLFLKPGVTHNKEDRAGRLAGEWQGDGAMLPARRGEGGARPMRCGEGGSDVPASPPWCGQRRAARQPEMAACGCPARMS